MLACTLRPHGVVRMRVFRVMVVVMVMMVVMPIIMVMVMVVVMVGPAVQAANTRTEIST